MCRRCLFILASIAFFLFPIMGFAYSPQKIIILYDAPNYYTDERDAVLSVQHLFRHFEVAVEKASVLLDDLPSLQDYDQVVIMNFEETVLPAKTLQELQGFEGNILWIGKGLGQFTRQREYGIKSIGKMNQFIDISYKGQKYDIGVKRDFEKVEVTEDTTILASFSNGLTSSPFIAKDKNLYYVSRIDLNEPLFYIFADILYDFLEISVKEEAGVLLRISDIHPFTKPEVLREKAEILLAHNIPFSVSVIPFYREEGTTVTTTLSEQEELIEVLRGIQAQGQVILLQGSTHFLSREQITTESYFKWKEKNQGSVAQWIEEIINEGMEELIRNGLYPTGFEAKHYALDRQAYEKIGEIFDVYVGNIQTDDWQETLTIYPWKLENLMGIRQYYPENLGFFNDNNPYELYRIKEDLEKLSLTRDYLGGISIEAQMPNEKLLELIQFLKEENLTYVDLSRETLEVRGANYRIRNFEEGLTYEGDHKKGVSLATRITQISFFLMSLILTFVLTLFLVIFIKSKKKTDQQIL